MRSSSQKGTQVPLDADDRIRSLWLLDTLDAAARRTLLAQARVARFDTGDTLYRVGAVANALHVVVTGRVRLVREHDGKIVFIHDEARGGCLGDVPLFEGVTYPATAVASEPTECLVIERAAILAAVAKHPPFALALLARLAARVRTLVERMDGNATRSTRVRLARLLLVRAPATPDRAFTLGVTQQQAAEELGTVRELVVRGLRALREEGVIDALGGGRYVVRDAAALERIARDD